eukprot:6210612-Pleurochrysis_carterae.AAC.2
MVVKMMRSRRNRLRNLGHLNERFVNLLRKYPLPSSACWAWLPRCLASCSLSALDLGSRASHVQQQAGVGLGSLVASRPARVRAHA